MSSLHEQISEQFFAFERHGRGWDVFDHPVSPEPTFRPFVGYSTPQIKDDGVRPTFLSSLVARLSASLSTKSTPDISESEEIIAGPEDYCRSEISELDISLPPDLNLGVESFIPILYSLARIQAPLAFELIGVNDLVKLQFAGDPEDMRLLERSLQAHVPAATVKCGGDFLESEWNGRSNLHSGIVEFGLERPWPFPIATDIHDILIDLAPALAQVKSGELGLFQVIFAPLVNDWKANLLKYLNPAGKPLFINAPKLQKASEGKTSSPLFAVVVRIASKAPSFCRSWEIASSLATAMGSLKNLNGNELVPLRNDDYPYDDHVDDVPRRQARRSGMILSRDELLSLVHLPTPKVQAGSFRKSDARTKGFHNKFNQPSGICLGTNEHEGSKTPVYLSPEERVRHMHVIGTSGTGKSSLLFNLIKQDIESGQGIAVFDCHGDLIDRILGSIPESRIEDVVLVDPSDEEYAVGFNILSAHSDLEKNLLASDLVAAFQRLSTSWGDQMGSVLNNAILAFLESSKGGTLGDLQRFLIESDFRNEFLKSVSDSQVLYYWKKAFPQLTGNKSIGPVLTRLGSFLDRKPIRYMVTQRENRLDFADIMNSGKIFLAKLPQGLIGEENAYLLGSFLVSKFQQIAMSRQAQSVSSRRDFWCYCDEFHNFITPSMAQILNGARKYRLGLILAHQELRQLQRSSEVASAVLANPYTRICFRVGDDDARKLADGFSFFQSKDLQNLPNYQAICRIERADGDFNLAIPNPNDPDEADAAEIRKRIIDSSRRKYAVPRKQVEAEQASAFVDFDSIVAEPRFKKAAKPPVEAPPPEPAPQPVEEPPKSAPPPVSEPPQPVIPREEPVERDEVATKPGTVPADLGRGGAQHKAVQRRLKQEAEKVGFRATIENEILDGKGSVDLLLVRSQLRIACEISFTTTTDHEVGNVAKCLKAEFPIIAVICTSKARLAKIKEAVLGSLGPDAVGRVSYFQPEHFIDWLKALPAPLPIPEKPKVTLGYSVKTSVSKMTPEERKQSEAAAVRSIAEAMKKKKPKREND